MEGSGITYGLWLFVFLAGCGQLSGFNLDTDNVLKKSGEPGSLFGFSLAMHWQTQPVNKKMLLVGAPRSKALKGQKSSVTGGLYKCDMSVNSPNCERIIFDNSEDRTKESKDNQWMGVSVSSQGPGGKVLTCAHRYQRRANVGNIGLETRDIIGRCVVLGEDLTIDGGTDEEGDNWHFCESRPRGHEMFGSCQQGVSATFDKRYHYLIFGAPGAYNWKGIVRLEQKNYTLLEMGIYDDGPYEVGDENEKNPDLVPSPPNSYLGFSLDSGSRLTDSDLTVVAGAPRAHFSGEVVLLKKGVDRNIMLEEFTLKGEGLASSFGYDLTVLDLNKDGWQDIVVGAPQYFEKEGEIGGAVYVFINKAGKWNTVKPIRIDGPQNSMFGLSVKHLGDIDQDGYSDFAVGAPYDDDGAGKVYIFHGSKTGLKSLEAVQTVSGRDVKAKMFGYSLAGNMDLDENSYPDLAIGSLSDAVFVYKTRPVISIKKEITFTPEKIDFTKKNCEPNFCLDVEACFTYTANPKSVSTKMNVAYSMQADADLRGKKLNSRAYFTGPSGNSFESNGVITIDGQGKKQCVVRKLTIQEDIRDKLNGIPVDVSVKIQDSKRKRRQGSTSPTPILDATEHATTRSEVNFLQGGCGQDSVCQSNLQMTYRYGHMLKAGEPFKPLPMEDGLPVISPNEHKQITLEVQVTNQGGDDAHEASVIASFPRSLSYESYDSMANGPPVACTANRNGSMVDCELGNPFRRDAQATVYIYLDTSSLSFDNTEVEIDLKLETTSEQKKIPAVKAKAKVTIALQLSVSGIAQPSQVYLARKAKGEPAGKTDKTLGAAVTYQFRISNLVKQLAGFGTTTLNIHWPKDTSSGNMLLYLMKISSTGVKQMQCTPKGLINPLNKEVNTRAKRGTDDSLWEGTISRLVDNKKQKTLSCDNGAKCVTIQCSLQELGSNAVITLNAHLWDSTITKEFSGFSPVEVVVQASLQFDSTTRNAVVENAATQVKMKVYHDKRAEAVSAGVPWWIIFLSILFALLLLGILAYILWKCGFFKRANYGEKIPSYSAVWIKRQDREITSGIGTWESPDKKSWMTNG
ncbi:integrin alpha-6-like isoform X1 [Xyrichtys novacula]|uniref:Integrin alpha-6-like isoform X1 n=1 Tax=Xyrichtys novacula TaxID=13765 RepID=A0AAV1GD24_XYRNO|nr:integrin alpha-6-like isoform X1 [Xyrichtys novacula]